MTDADTPRTTVVIPVWDSYVAQRLVTATESIRAQDRRAQLLLVDNASNVPLPDVPQHELLRTRERLSVGAARNAGLARVQTPYVMFWDADDLMEPGVLGFLEDHLEADRGLVAMGAAIIEDPRGVRHRWPRPWIAGLIRHPGLFAVVDCVWSMFPTTGATLMRTEVVRECGGFADADSGEDWCLGAALAFRGRFGWSERAGRHYLQHQGSVWATYGTAPHQLANAAAVRRRLVNDGRVPGWLRRSMPLVALAQWSAVGAHLGAARLRKTVRSRSVGAAT